MPVTLDVGSFLFLTSFPLALVSVLPVYAFTDGPDVSALSVMYTSLNSPSQLTGWKSNGGDPCGEDWKGITCSGSSVTEIKLPGLGMTGSMGYQLSSLTSVTYFDLSKNNLQGDIPYHLPPNAVNLNLAGCGFSGGIPYSISQMTNIEYLNLASNQLNGQLHDMFGKLSTLTVLDLSSNELTGELPQSFGALKRLKTLQLQNNQFTGSINVLATLPLEDLNVRNNHFSGWIPNQLKDISNLETAGNSWSSGPAPPQFTSQKDVQEKRKKDKVTALTAGVLAGLVIGLLFLIIILAVVLTRIRSSSHSIYIDEGSGGHNRSLTPLVSRLNSVESPISVQMLPLQSSSLMGLKSPASDNEQSFDNNDFMQTNSKKNTDSSNPVVFSLMDLTEATSNFSASRLIGEGTIGRVYKAKYPDGKIFAVKEIYSANNSVSIFEEIVKGISRLHHPNITELIGYCKERSYRLLLYEFLRNGSLHNFLHLSDEYSRPLTWETRVRIALGTARAIEYLHEICSPSAVHKNVKSANILLDEELNPHLADCGLSVFYKDTTENLGQGYNAPECTSASSYTSKSDVYSFGVVMLELMTGRVAFDSFKQWSEQSLVKWAIPQLHDIDALTKMVDPALRGLYPPKSVSRFADVIALCVQNEPEFRPPMSEVVQSLVRCIQRPSMNKKGGNLSAASSGRSDDSDNYY